ncbi:MAG: class II fructose-bisphosphate aldolase, partial [Clostridia bacterium]|nr:class II fructose-bisphosphate aldolase [Clostridia bacterium]
MLVNMKDLLRDAQRGGYAVGSFSVANMEMVRGVIAAAEEAKAPIILQIAEVRLNHSPLALIGPLMVTAAKTAKVPVAVHLDHGLTLPTIELALSLGFTSVMFDGSHLPLEENIAMTKKVAALAKPCGAAVEAEIGCVGGSEDGSKDIAMRCTDPAQAERFARETGVDALAVAIGNAHGNY